MGTSANGQPPFSLSDVQPRAGVDTFGSGGANLAPNQGVPAVGAVLLDVMKRVAKQVANVAALQATVEADRADGQAIFTLDTYTLWVWEDGSSAAAGATVIEPTDISGGAHGGLGRYVAVATTPDALGGQVVQRITTDIPLATIQSETSGAAFNVGAVLPANARLLGAEINVLTPLSGGSAASAAATLQGGADAAGSILGSASVFTGAAPINAVPGSNPYQSRGGQQIKMTITGDGTHALSTLTAGHLSVDLFVAIIP